VIPTPTTIAPPVAWPGTVTPAPLNPVFPWLTIDIETSEAKPTEVERWVRDTWAPSPNWKPATIGERYLERLAKQKELAALIDKSPIRVVSLLSPTETRVLHDLYQHAPKMEGRAVVESFADEATMMRTLASFLETRTGPESILAGHNIRHFDLPKIRRSMIANGISLPAILASKNAEVFDTMTRFVTCFSLSNNPFVGLNVVLESLGLPNHKRDCDGALVGELISNGAFDTVIKYSLLDAISEADVFLKMSGRT
jgi:hypothetical protein